MKQKIKLVKGLDPVFESIMLLTMVANEDNKVFYEFKNHTLEEYFKDNAEGQQIGDFVKNLCEKAIELFKEDMDEVTALFGKMEKSLGLTLGELSMYSHRTEIIEEADYSHVPIKDIYEKYTEKEKDGSFLGHLDADMDDKGYEEIMSYSDKGRMCAILEYVQQLEVSKETKEKILDCYLHRDAYVDRVSKLVEKAYGLLASMEKEYSRIADLWQAYWTRDEDTIFNMMDLLGVPLDKMDMETLVLAPSFIQCMVVDISLKRLDKDGKKNKTAVIHMGVLVTEDLTKRFVEREIFTEENLQECIKALGDKSKYDILMFIKDKAAYGSEIAKEFGLTTATVSHHMTKLVNLQMVSLVQQGGKSYYQTRTDKMEEIFNALKKVWCSDK